MHIYFNSLINNATSEQSIILALRKAVSREKQNYSRHVKILPEIGRLGIFSRRPKVIKVKFLGRFEIFCECLPRIRDDLLIEIFRVTFIYTCMVLLKQHLLGLPSPIIFII